MIENNSTESSTWKTVVGDKVILVESTNPWYESVKNNKCEDEETHTIPVKKNNNFLRILCFLMITIMILIILQLTMAKN